MRAVVVQSPGRIEVVTADDPVPGPEDVVVAVEACGLCGMDLHIVDGDLPEVRYPMVPGHEVAGRIAELGTAVTGLSKGDLVAVDPSVPCRTCPYCRAGRENLCELWQAVGVTSPGGAAEYVRVPAAQCYALPSATPATAGALVEPLACAVHALDRLRPDFTDEVLLYGAGTMGLLLAQLLRRAGVRSVSIVDSKLDRLSAAQVMGATAVATGADAFARPMGWDVVADTTGAVAAIEDGLGRVRKGGTFLQFGLANPAASARFSPHRMCHAESRMVGAVSGHRGFARARDLLASGAIDTGTLLTHSADLADYSDALSAFRSGVGLKTQVLPASTE